MLDKGKGTAVNAIHTVEQVEERARSLGYRMLLLDNKIIFHLSYLDVNIVTRRGDQLINKIHLVLSALPPC